MKKEDAFTLAEVLITLGIIGIVAALTLPALINKSQNKQLEVGLKKAYSNLSQVIQRVVQEDFGGVIDQNSAKKISSKIVQYYKNGSLCTGYNTNKGCPNAGISNFCTFMTNTYKNYNGTNKAACVGNDSVSGTIDGVTIYFDEAGVNEGSQTYGKILMLIDVNGWKKNPNKLGHDMFMFEITKVGKVLPMGAEGMSWTERSNCSMISTANTNGYGCTVKALNDKDYFKNLPK